MSNKVEKLEAELAATTTIEQKIDVLNALAWELRDQDTKRGLELAQTAFHLAKTGKYQKGLAESLVAQSQFIFSRQSSIIQRFTHKFFW